MKKKKMFLCIIFILLIIAIIIICITRNKKNAETNSEDTKQTEVIRTDILNTISSSSYIESGLEENKTLHTGYYFEEKYFEINEYIKEGEKILKYTNGEYMLAPYDCVITNSQIPESGEKCTNNHYITIKSTSTLKIELGVEEDELENIFIGQEAQIEIQAMENKVVTGYVSKIDNTATYSSNGSTFGIEVGFENDGDILLGMTAKCSIILEKAENVIAVANEAIEEQNGKKYVTIESDDGNTKKIEVETGISNNAYTEIKSGLEEGETALIEESTENTQSNNRNNQKMQRQNQENIGDYGGGKEMGEPPEAKQ